MFIIFYFYRCYLILIGVLYFKFGGVLVGLVGIGKIEIIKDLGKVLVIQIVVFNCFDQFDFMVMGKFFKGLVR